MGSGGSVTFQVFAGTTQLGSTVTRTGSQGSSLIDVNVSGRPQIRLVVGPNNNGINQDHGDWGDAKFVC